MIVCMDLDLISFIKYQTLKQLGKSPNETILVTNT